MKKNLVLWSVTSGLAGFLFGFDTVVISGAEQTIQSLWGLSPAQHGVAISAALYGTVVGALCGGVPADVLGRRRTLQMIGLLYVVGAVWSALAQDVVSFSVARALGGFGIGVSTVAAPLYISEIAPAGSRGRLTGLFQFNIVLGILVAFLSNSLLSGFGDQAWRLMLGVMAAPAIVYAIACLFIPESPRWLLVRKGARAQALTVLGRIDPQASLETLNVRADEIAAAAHPAAYADRFWTPGVWRAAGLAVLIAFFNQASGINAILYFAPRIFEMTGLGAHAALLQSVGIGVTNLVFTFIGLWLIDRLGRRTLLFVGCIGYVLSLGGAAFAFATAHYAIVPVCIFAFIASHAVGQGAVIWVYIAEIFPTRQRAFGQALGSSTHWIMAAVLTTVFPILVTRFPPAQVFGFFAVMMAVQLLWVLFAVIETRGASLEEVQARLMRGRQPG